MAQPLIDDEDKAQSRLGSQSAFMSMLNIGKLSASPDMYGTDRFCIASNFGRELPDIDDYGESDGEEDLRSSQGMQSICL